MAMTDEQRAFMEQMALRIPRLLDAIRQGNVKSEFIVGLKRIDDREVRLKLVAEVVDAGANPLQTHSLQRQDDIAGTEGALAPASTIPQTVPANVHTNNKAESRAYKPARTRRRPRKRS